MVLRIAFIVNPVAGIGGPAGLKGSDAVAIQAAEKGYEPSAAVKAERFLRRLKKRAPPGSIRIFTAPGVMGGVVTQEAGWKTGSLGAESFDDDPFSTDAEDTRRAAHAALELDMDLVVFVGGDGTARDIAEAVDDKIAVLGVPAGVKMFSECFAETPEGAAQLVCELAAGFHEGDHVPTLQGDLLDLDEDAYREGRVQPRPHGAILVPRSPRIMAAKCPLTSGSDVDEAASAVVERMQEQPEPLYILGSGSSLMAVKRHLGIEGSLIGIDAVKHDTAAGWNTLARDADAHTLERLIENEQTVVLVLTPIGGQGSIIGRGTGPITAKVVRAALPEGVWIVAPHEKLTTLRDGVLYVDTGDPVLDQDFPRHLRVMTAPGREKIMRVAIDREG